MGIIESRFNLIRKIAGRPLCRGQTSRTTRRIANRPDLALLAAVGAFAAAYAVASLWLPMGWDHGMMATVGIDLAQGKMPYKDSWELKAPLAFVPFSVAWLLFGNVMWGVRVVDLLILGPLLLFYTRELKRQSDFVIASGATLSLYLWFAHQGWFNTGQPDPWASMLAAVAVCITFPRADRARPEPHVFFWSGLLIGLAGLIKPVYFGIGLAPLISAAFAPTAIWSKLSIRLRDISLLAAGAATPVLACLIYLAWGGALSDAFEAQILYNIGTYSKIHRADPAQAFFKIISFFSQPHVTLLVLLSLAAFCVRHQERVLVAQLLAWIFAALVAVIVQGKYYTSHWAALFPALVACAALGAHALSRAGDSATAGRVVVTLGSVLFLLHISVEPARDIRRWLIRVVGGSADDYHIRYKVHYGDHWWFTPAHQVAAAEHIRNNSVPQDGVLIWGNDATIRFLADRPSPTRFGFSLPLSLDGPFRAIYRTEAMGDLKENPPKFIVIGLTWEGVPKEEGLRRFPELSNLLANSYAFDIAYGNVHLYRRKDGSKDAQALPAARAN